MMKRLLIPERRFDSSKPEMIDLPDADPLLLRDELRNLRIINRRFGGLSSVRKALENLIAASPPDRTLELLDLGTGSGDQAVAIARLCRRQGRKIAITAVDNNEVVLAEARHLSSGFDEIQFEQSDIRSLSYRDRSFDIVLCSLTLHHFTREDAVGLLTMMDRLSRTGFVLNDLSRSYLAIAGAWLYTHLTTSNVMTRTDAIASLFASFTEEELAEMLQAASVEDAEISRAALFRFSVVQRKRR